MTPKMILSDRQIHSLVSENKYRVPSETRFQSRCIDGRYENGKDLPALAVAGADIGELAALYATANLYAFTVDPAKALKSLQELVGADNIHWHTDEHGDQNLLGSGCGHLTQLRLDPEAFNLTPADIQVLNDQMVTAEKEGGKQTLLHGNHGEAAVLLIKGDYGVYPQHMLDTDEGKFNTQVFISHQTLTNARHRAWCEKLIQDGAVILYNDLDEEYLYEVLSSTSEDHLFEISKRLAKDLPIYQVMFSQDGSFEIEKQGFV